MNILIYAGLCFKFWSGKDLRGVGGSEIAIANLSKSFVKMGHKVVVSGIVQDENVDGVQYLKMDKLQSFLDTSELDIIIISRYINFLDRFKYSAKKVYLWMHDIDYQPVDFSGCFSGGSFLMSTYQDGGKSVFDSNLEKIDGIICLTEWHRKCFLEKHLKDKPETHNKVYVINNGINPTTWSEDCPKKPFRFIWSSRPERGLGRVLQVFPLLRKKIPDAELYVSSYIENENYVMAIKGVEGCHWLGCLEQTELHREMSRSDIWFYPTEFQETSCITSIEMQKSGVFCISSNLAGLGDTVGDRGVVIDTKLSDQDMVDAIIQAMDKKEDCVTRAKEWAEQQTWDQRAIAWECLTKRKTNICLNMIVKNETKVLPRLFASIKDVIDYYVISDTGSTDGTPELIKQIMDSYGIPGEIHHHEWVNFGHNRQLALDAATKAHKTDFVLIIDADEELEYMDSKFYEKLDVNYTYVIDKHHVGHTYIVPYLINIKKGQWQWHAPVHNYIGDKNCVPAKKLNDVWILYHEGEGAKSHGVTRQEKYLRDAVVLEKELEKNPNDARSRFYLAQSYMDADAWDKAIKNFKDVLGMNGWIEEQYVACWRISQILMRNNAPVREIVGWVAQAQELLPRRLEALYGFVSWCRKKEKYALGYLLGRIGTSIAAPEKFSLYINPEIYKWEFLDELSICAYWVGDYVLSQELAEKVLEKMPEDGTQWWVGERGRVANNLKYALQKLADVKV